LPKQRTPGPSKAYSNGKAGSNRKKAPENVVFEPALRFRSIDFVTRTLTDIERQAGAAPSRKTASKYMTLQVFTHLGAGDFHSYLYSHSNRILGPRQAQRLCGVEAEA